MRPSEDSKERFSCRVGDYVKWRPSYPAASIDALFQELGLNAGSSVADIGAGTGKLSRLLAGRVARLYAVEPNKDMLAAAVAELSSTPGFIPVRASAEETSLPDASLDMIVCAQAFHWFDREACKKEFRRILKPGSFAVLIWNRRLDESPFGEAYERLLKSLEGDYRRVDHRRLKDADFAAFFEGGRFQRKSFASSQSFDFAGLLGRSRSSSYVPLPGSEAYANFEAGLKSLFESFQRDGLVEMEYLTEAVWGLPAES